MTIDVFERYAALDPARDAEMRPQWTAMTLVPLASDYGREPAMQTQQMQSMPPRPPQKTSTRWLVAGAAFIVILILGAVVLFSNQSATDVPPAETPATVEQAIAGTTITPAEALITANAFHVAYNAGESDEVLALFSADATFFSNFTGSTTTEESEMGLVWDAAQGTELTSGGCTVTPTEPRQLLNVLCVGETRDALSQALGASAVPTRVLMAVTPEGITRLEYTFGQPDFDTKVVPFGRWMDAHHPGDADAAAGFGHWTTVDEARALGQIRAQYAREWAEYLKQNRCTYRDDC